MKDKIENFYKKNLYTEEQVHKFVEKGVITEEEYKLIIGSDK